MSKVETDNFEDLPQESPDYVERNRQIYQPVLEVRRTIAAQWQEVVELLDAMKLERSAHKEEKILRADATPAVVRNQIKRIISDNNLEVRAKSGRLMLALGEVDENVVIFQGKRSEFAEENMGIAGGFLDGRPHYFSRQLDIDERMQIARLGVLRAAETWNPERGTFSTYGYVWIRSNIQRAATKAQTTDSNGVRTLSLDRKFSGATKDGKGSLHDVLKQTREMQVDHSSLYMVEREMLRELIATLHPSQQRTAELRWLEGGHLNAKEIATILEAEGYLTPEKARKITDEKVRQWIKKIERMLMREMKKKLDVKKA